MTKKIFFSSALILFLGLSILGCNKCEQLPHDDSKEYPLNYRVVRFNTIEEYEEFIEETDEKVQERFFERMRVNGFKDYFSKPEHLQEYDTMDDGSESTDLLMDHFLGRLLNEHGIVNIGKYLYRVDMRNEKVYALRYAKEDNYSEAVTKLTANRKGDDILIFSTYDDVLDEIQDIDNPQPQKKEKCGNASRFDRISPTYSNYDNGIGQVQFRAKYHVGGIHFSVRISAENWDRNYSYPDPSLKFEVKYGGHYAHDLRMRRKPCNGNSNTYHHGGIRDFDTEDNSYNNGKKLYWTGYSKTRGLNGYRVLVRGIVNGESVTELGNSQGWFGREMNSNF